MRRALVLIGIAALTAVALLASPAAAKGFKSVTFTGPGLPAGGITIHPRMDDGHAVQVLWYTGVFQTLAGPTPWERGLERNDLGPQYEMTVSPDWSPRTHVHAFVYPYAKGGPWTYIPSGQTIDQYGNRLDSGWWKVGHRAIGSDSAIMVHQFRTFLVRIGFPAQAPAVTAPASTSNAANPAPAAAASHAGTAWPSWIWIAIVIGIGATLMLVTVRNRRRAVA